MSGYERGPEYMAVVEQALAVVRSDFDRKADDMIAGGYSPRAAEETTFGLWVIELLRIRDASHKAREDQDARRAPGGGDEAAT